MRNVSNSASEMAWAMISAVLVATAKLDPFEG
jgi:hypothetical protein